MLNFVGRLKSMRVLTVALLAMVMTLSVYLVGYGSQLFQASIVGVPQHAPFDGTTYPVQKAPNWVGLGSADWDKSYDALSSSDLVDIPYYDPSQLSISTDDLVWGNADHDVIRNAKITYSVPYLGNYMLDGRENAGSHPAVDIKIPSNTPIFAIANGTVTKVSEKSTGFGFHIVVQHNNVPTLDNPDAKTVLHSSYSHLAQILVEDGEVVTKGQQIALSGSSGTATTPHLHFQIDNDSAPWRPFWPFTWQEVSEAGLDFFSAINEGLGREKAVATTVNPMKYVQTYLDADAVISALEIEVEEVEYIPLPEVSDAELGNNAATSYVNGGDSSDEGDVVGEIVIEIVEDPLGPSGPEVVVVEELELNFELDVKPIYYVGGDYDFKVYARDQNGELFLGGFAGEAVVSTAQGLGTAQNAIFSSSKFRNGVFETAFQKVSQGRDRLVIEHDGETYYSDWFEIKNDDFVLDFGDVGEKHGQYDAIAYLVGEGIISGYPDKTFRPRDTVSRVEAIKFILEGVEAIILKGKLPFSDVSDAEWYSDYLFTAYTGEVVDGYKDGTFRPGGIVNRAEFYKILFNGMGVTVSASVDRAPYDDVKVDDWFSPYIAHAKKIGLIDPDLKSFFPNAGMTRAEVADVIYRLMTQF